jgi:Protein of unknown function (DUF2796)
VSAQRWLTVVASLLVGPALTLVMVMPAANAGSTAKKRQQHGTHVHGTAKLNIAVEERTATVEFESPADSIIGFEHKAKTAAEQQQQARALDLLKNKIGSMVIFEAALGCRLSPTSLDVVQQDQEHSEVHGIFAVSCDRHLAGSKVRFGFTKTFPALLTVDVQVVAPTQQVGATIKQDRGEVEVPH